MCGEQVGGWISDHRTHWLYRAQKLAVVQSQATRSMELYSVLTVWEGLTDDSSFIPAFGMGASLVLD